MRPHISDILTQLKAEGLAPAEADAGARAALVKAEADDIPWYIRALVGLGAWAATAFLLGFLLGLGGFRGDASRVIVGLMLIGGAIWLRRSREAEFVRQSAVAMSLAGQGFLIAGLAGMFDSPVAVGLAGVVLSVAMIWLMPDRVHRFLSTIAGSVAAIVAAGAMHVRGAVELTAIALVAVTAYVWRIHLRERDESVEEMLIPVGYGLVVALFGVLAFSGFSVFGELSREVVGGRQSEFHLGAPTTIAIAAALIALAITVLKEHGTPLQSGLTFAAVAGVVALALGTLSTPGIVAGAAVLALAFDRRNPVLMGIAVVFLLVFGSMYYYSLSLTLLEKSGVLVGSGLLFLAIRSRLGPHTEEEVRAR